MQHEVSLEIMRNFGHAFHALSVCARRAQEFIVFWAPAVKKFLTLLKVISMQTLITYCLNENRKTCFIVLNEFTATGEKSQNVENHSSSMKNFCLRCT